MNSGLKFEKDRKQLFQITEDYLKNVLSEVTKNPANLINSKESFSSYGMDSLMITEFLRRMEEEFGDLPRTLLFEYTSINRLSEYLTENHIESLEKKFGLEDELSASVYPLIEPDCLKVRHEAVENMFSVREKQECGQNANIKNDIAIIGIGGKYPGSRNLEEFWRNLAEGKRCISEVPSERWDWKQFYDKDPQKAFEGKIYCKWGAFIEGIKRFDPLLFNITPAESKQMLPEERIMLEVVWNMLEDSGYKRDNLADKRVGVFIGVTANTYPLKGVEGWPQVNGFPLFVSSFGIPTRISSFFKLTGPSIAIDTACSSSLAAVHLACESILRGECTEAIAGGINLYMHPSRYNFLCQVRSVSSKGRSDLYEKGGDGFIPAEGAGAIFLKSLESAVNDGDNIYGIIKASSVLHKGESSGYLLPTPKSQISLIKETIRKSGVAPETINYMELSATGSEATDAIEWYSINKAFGELTDRKGFCALGSIKPNMGHPEAAAGIAQITKTLLQMRYRKLLPNLVAVQLNPEVKLEQTPFYIPERMVNWNSSKIIKDGVEVEYPRRAGISSFGAGGVESHIILEEYDGERAAVMQGENEVEEIIILSAKTKAQLNIYLEDLKEFISKLIDSDMEYDYRVSLSDIAYTLQAGREEFNERFSVTAKTKQELLEALKSYTSGIKSSYCVYSGSANNNEVSCSNEEIEEIYIGRDFERAAKLWAKGILINWERLRNGRKPRRISLPTYPFEKKICWIEKSMQEKEEKTFSGEKRSYTQETQRLEDIEEKVLAIVGGVLELELCHIDVEARFMEYGVNSMLGIKVIGEINKNFRMELEEHIIFDYSSIRDISKYLAEIIPDETGVLSKKSLENAARTKVETAFSSSRESICEEVSQRNNYRPGDIAVIGVSGRFPGAKNPEEFWENLKNGICSVTEIPSERWAIEEYYDVDPEKPNRSYSKWGGFINDADSFDPLFFNMSPSDAEVMDPQQRVFLEECWKALEDAGYSPGMLNNTKCGVFAGTFNNDYNIDIYNHESDRLAQSMLGNLNAILASRIAYVLNLKGPAISIDSACSSSLAAIHLACKSLQMKEADMMLAGGIALFLSERPYIMMSKAGMLSPEGKCKAFDSGANGIVPGEAAGVVVLKLLEKAIRDGDHIYGIIKGSATNQDGKTNGITAPSAESQKDLELEVYAENNINPESITYIEAHGTGTKLGDPVEITALKKAFSHYTEKKQYCGIGSVKSNIGHTQSASGVISLIKVLLCIKYKMLPPTLFVGEENRLCGFNNSPFYVCKRLKEWERENGYLRRAAISSFGISGTNCHLVVEEPPEEEAIDSSIPRDYYIFPFSAKNEAQLKVYAQEYVKFLERITNTSKSQQVDIEDLLQKTKNEILEAVSSILCIENSQVDIYEDLTEAGFDRIHMAKLLNGISIRYNLEIKHEEIFENTSVNALAEYLCKNNADMLLEYYGSSLKFKAEKEDLTNGISPSSVAYTLQTCRDEMDERLIILSTGLEELKKNLYLYCLGTSKSPTIFTGNAGRNKRKIKTGQEPCINGIKENIGTGAYGFNSLAEIAENWVDGGKFDWKILYEGHMPKKVPLPTYPFARERYWHTGTQNKLHNAAQPSISKLHPLIDENISTLQEQCFKKTFKNEEFFLKDHVVEERLILPGAAYLEMALAAGNLSNREYKVVKLQNVVWERSLVLEENHLDANIGLYADNNIVNFEISTTGKDNERLIHCRGKIGYSEGNKGNQPEPLDVDAVKKRCLQIRSGDELYKEYRGRGLKYGPGFKCIDGIYVSETEALSYIRLPKMLDERFRDYVLHPAVMDSAFQTIPGVTLENKAAEMLLLPFAVGEIDIIRPLEKECYAYSVSVQGRSASNEGVKKYNIRLVDKNGNVLVAVKDFSVRPFRNLSTASNIRSEALKVLKKLKDGELSVERVEQLLRGGLL